MIRCMVPSNSYQQEANLSSFWWGSRNKEGWGFQSECGTSDQSLGSELQKSRQRCELEVQCESSIWTLFCLLQIQWSIVASFRNPLLCADVCRTRSSATTSLCLQNSTIFTLFTSGIYTSLLGFAPNHPIDFQHVKLKREQQASIYCCALLNMNSVSIVAQWWK